MVTCQQSMPVISTQQSWGGEDTAKAEQETKSPVLFNQEHLIYYLITLEK